MDATRFDQLAKDLVAPGTRRQLLRLLTALPLLSLLAAFFGLPPVEIAAGPGDGDDIVADGRRRHGKRKRRRKRRRKRKRGNQAPSPPPKNPKKPKTPKPPKKGPCIPACSGKVCGPDGCGGRCGVPCSSGCCAEGTCEAGTSEAACGAAGQTCTVCTAGQPCDNNACVDTCGAIVTTGNPSQAQFALQDGDGIQSISAPRSDNATPTIPPFTPGTKDIVVVTATKSMEGSAAVVVLVITDTKDHDRRCGITF